MDEILERMENDRISYKATLPKRMIKLEQKTKIILNYLQSTVPSNVEMEPKEDSEEQSKEDTIENGEVFHETAKVNLKRSRSDMEEEYSFENKRSRIVKDEISDTDDHALDFNWTNKISSMLIWQYVTS